MKLLSDRIQEFIDWMEANTDFSEWDDKIKVIVQKKLIEVMIPLQERSDGFEARIDAHNARYDCTEK